ncbi:MAG: DUF2254 domain-containing protein [Methanosarcinales archaeon]|nr:DUF2254 domain-containing protein [Methanosarcinales archaeon]MCD4816375.1 DUF2254 domain-containing protein [Methanosarcinales archaeon]
MTDIGVLLIIVVIIFTLFLSVEYINIDRFFMVLIIPIIKLIILTDIAILWINRLLYYFIIGFLIYYFALSIFSNIGFLTISPDSARYMISALVQSEAAILAIVITLSLVIVQQTATSYSPRVVKVFVNRNPDFWILIGVYIMSMVYGLWVITQINENSSGDLLEYNNYMFFDSFEKHIHLIFSIGTFSFVILIPYILATLDLLRPSKIIDILSDDLVILSSVNKEKYPIQPIIDIIISSMMKHDYETVENGLEAITNKTKYVILNKNLFWNQDNKQSKFIDFNFEYNATDNFGHIVIQNIEKIGIIAIDNLDYDSLNKVVHSLCKIGKFIGVRKLTCIFFLFSSFGKIGELSAKKQLDFILFDIISSILKVKDAFNIENINSSPELYEIKMEMEIELEKLVLLTIQNIIIEAEKQGLNHCINSIYDGLLKEKLPDLYRHSYMVYDGYV